MWSSLPFDNLQTTQNSQLELFQVKDVCSLNCLIYGSSKVVVPPISNIYARASWSMNELLHYPVGDNNRTLEQTLKHCMPAQKKPINIKINSRNFLLQSRCSILRGVILCLCLNLTYANIVRFPRELERHGIAFLLPYLLLLFTIGLPIILLEISLGQFLGQGSAHTWRVSPFFKGNNLIIINLKSTFLLIFVFQAPA